MSEETLTPENLYEHRILPVRLTEDELRTKSDLMALAVTKHVRLQDDAKEAAKRAKEAIQQEEQKIRDLAREVSTKTEYRTVDCRWLPRGDIAELIRTDTGEVIQTRQLTQRERQLLLPDVNAAGDGNGGRGVGRGRRKSSATEDLPLSPEQPETH